MRGLEEVAEEAGISYRQANYWYHAGYLRVRWLNNKGEEIVEGGTGHHAMLDPAGERKLVEMVAMVNAGFHHKRASELANYVVAGAQTIRLREGLLLCREGVLVSDADVDASL